MEIRLNEVETGKVQGLLNSLPISQLKIVDEIFKILRDNVVEEPKVETEDKGE